MKSRNISKFKIVMLRAGIPLVALFMSLGIFNQVRLRVKGNEIKCKDTIPIETPVEEKTKETLIVEKVIPKITTRKPEDATSTAEDIDDFAYLINNNLRMIREHQKELAELEALEKEDDRISKQMEVANLLNDNVLTIAYGSLGRISYLWGGKPKEVGYYEDLHLDCSGFVEWVYLTAGYTPSFCSKMYSTSVILTSFEDIPRSELRPGDLGLINHGETTNHVGIYVGNDQFIHCSSSGSGTVITDPGEDSFVIFKRVEPTIFDCGMKQLTGCDLEVVGEDYKVHELQSYIGQNMPLYVQNKLDKSIGIGEEADIVLSEDLLEAKENVFKELSKEFGFDISKAYEADKDTYEFFGNDLSKYLEGTFDLYLTNPESLLLSAPNTYLYYENFLKGEKQNAKKEDRS